MVSFQRFIKKIHLMDFLFCRWALAQTGILLVMGAWQMRHLKSFFEARAFLRPRNWFRETLVLLHLVGVCVNKIPLLGAFFVFLLRI